MARVQIEDVIDGAVIYKVTVVPSTLQTWLSMMVIVGQPYMKTHGFFCMYRYQTQFGIREDTFSLEDANIVPNTYNQHAAFTTLKEAQDYAAKFK